MLSRDEWIENSHFLRRSAREILNEVLDSIAAVKGFGQPPVVIFDLDSTLYEVQHRTFEILREWADHPESEPFGDLRVLLREKLVHAHVGYSILDTLVNLGVEDDPRFFIRAERAAKRFWRSRFFTDHYLRHDKPYVGAREFVREVYDTGSRLAYLTGRDEPGMRFGTVENLKRDGFPVPGDDERVHLFMKDRRETEDLAFKVSAVKEIQKLGAVVASFENEPRNLVALQRALPDAIHVFVKTVYSDRTAEATTGLYLLEQYVHHD